MVLVTGASGFLGGALVRQLVADGVAVRIIKRSHSDISHLDDIRDKIDISEGDVLDIPSLEIAMEGVDCIYHSAAVIGYDASYYDAMYKCNIEGTANVVNTALYKGVRRILHVSSIAAIGGKPEELITENTKWEKNQWTTHYGITKMLAEREIWRGIQEGLEGVIVNPGIIIGTSHNQNKATMRVFKQIASRKMPFYTNGTNGFIDVRDVVNCSIQLMNGPFQADRYILIAENRTFKSYFETIARQLQVPAPRFALNKWIGFAAAAADRFASWLVPSRKRGISSENLKVSLETFRYSNDKIKQALNYQFTPLEDTIAIIAQQISTDNGRT
ncbi:MAG TPA: SDR family NAD(P)-dependent oxidoreductase [Chitinophagales bacterium]|nr:SDR family NAD(P)-dependent oxidoreductase [Chitinophagales bacterium]